MLDHAHVFPHTLVTLTKVVDLNVSSTLTAVPTRGAFNQNVEILALVHVHETRNVQLLITYHHVSVAQDLQAIHLPSALLIKEVSSNHFFFYSSFSLKFVLFYFIFYEILYQFKSIPICATHFPADLIANVEK